MTDEQGLNPENPPTPSAPRKLVIADTGVAKPRFMTPALKAQLEEEAKLHETETARLQEEARLREIEEAKIREAEEARLKEEARLREIEEAKLREAEEARLQEEARLREAEEARLQEEARLNAEQEAALKKTEEQQPQQIALDPKISEALAKLKEAQKELEQAQEMAMAGVTAAAPAAPPAEASPEQAPSEPAAAVPAINKALFNTGVAATQQKPLKGATVLQKKAVSPSATAGMPQAASAPNPQAATPLASAPAAPKLSATAPTTGTTPSQAVKTAYMVPAPQSLVKSKKYITLVSVFGVLILIVGGLLWNAYLTNKRQQEENDLISRLSKLGASLNEKAYDLGKKDEPQLKYDSKAYGIEVIPNKKEAQLLLGYVRSFKESKGWEASMHLLSIMAAMQPDIADMVIADLEKNYKAYTDSKLGMFVTLLAVQKEASLQSKLSKLAKAFGAQKLPAKQALVIREMRYGMTPGDFAEVMDMVSDPKTPDEVRKAFSDVASYLIPKVNDAQRAALAKSILAALKTVDPKNRFTLLELLARTGTPQAMNYLKGEITDDKFASSNIMRVFAVWPNDSIFPELRDFIKSGKIKNPEVLQDLESALLYQLAYNRDRKDDEALALFQPFVDDANAQTDPEKKQKAKSNIIGVLAQLSPRGYVVKLLEDYQKDPDKTIADKAKTALTTIKEKEAKKNAPVKTRAEKQKEIQEIMQGISTPNT